MNRPRRAMVLDQAAEKIGFAVIDDDPNTPVSFGVNGRLKNHGVVRAPKQYTLTERLEILKADIRQLINYYQPDEIVCEQTYYIQQRSAATSHAMAAILQVCKDLAHEHGLDFFTQHPATIKKLFTGKGNAAKEEMKSRVGIVWGLPSFRILDDNHADALAAAYVWLYQAEKIRKKQGKRALKA